MISLVRFHVILCEKSTERCTLTEMEKALALRCVAEFHRVANDDEEKVETNRDTLEVGAR